MVETERDVMNELEADDYGRGYAWIALALAKSWDRRHDAFSLGMRESAILVVRGYASLDHDDATRKVDADVRRLVAARKRN